jgi:hypothetical protein
MLFTLPPLLFEDGEDGGEDAVKAADVGAKGDVV